MKQKDKLVSSVRLLTCLEEPPEKPKSSKTNMKCSFAVCISTKNKTFVTMWTEDTKVKMSGHNAQNLLLNCNVKE